MELSEYREEFLTQLREDAVLYENPNQIQFIEESLNLLEKQEEVIDPIPYLCNINSNKFSISLIILLNSYAPNLTLQKQCVVGNIYKLFSKKS